MTKYALFYCIPGGWDRDSPQVEKFWATTLLNKLGGGVIQSLLVFLSCVCSLVFCSHTVLCGCNGTDGLTNDTGDTGRGQIRISQS